jgi:glycosyltransferase involved in cell wall biosynthesis
MAAADQPLVSVVTPVYNGERYLAECIESVLAQTYRHWEYIIVDNCSTDRTATIAETYRRRDSRIRLHRNDEFVSALQNHHIAFRRLSAASKYCKVLHADDWLFPECLMRMVEVAEAHPSVGIVGAYRLDDVWVNLDGLPYWKTVIPGHEICRSTLLRELYVFGSPSSLLIRSDLIRDRPVVYDETLFPRHADVAACYELLQHTDFGFVHQVLTYTRRPQEARSSFSRRLGTNVVEHLLMVKKYGPIYLQPAEYEACLQRHLREYFQFLAKSAFLRPDRQFWRYHRQALRSLEIPRSSLRLAGAVLAQALQALLAPLDTAAKLARVLRHAARL